MIVKGKGGWVKKKKKIERDQWNDTENINVQCHRCYSAFIKCFFVFQLSLLLKYVVSKGKELFRPSGGLRAWPLWLQGTGNRTFTSLWLFCFDLLFFYSSPLQFIWINSNLSSSLHKIPFFLLFFTFLCFFLLPSLNLSPHGWQSLS